MLQRLAVFFAFVTTNTVWLWMDFDSEGQEENGEKPYYKKGDIKIYCAWRVIDL